MIGLSLKIKQFGIGMTKFSVKGQRVKSFCGQSVSVNIA